jgi:odorant receptor
MAIGTAAYETDFLDFNLPMKKKLILIIARAQKPLEIKVGNWTAMSLENFQKLLNTAYTFFNIIRTINQ